MDNVVEGDRQLFVTLDRLRPEAPAEHVVSAAVPVVEPTSVVTVQIAHPLREVRTRCLDDEVIVVSHQAGGMDAPAVALPHAIQNPHEDMAVVDILVDRAPIVAARRDVVEAAGNEIPAWSAHGSDVRREKREDESRKWAETVTASARHEPRLAERRCFETVRK